MKINNLIFVVGLIALTILAVGLQSQQKTGFSISNSGEQTYETGAGIPEEGKSVIPKTGVQETPEEKGGKYEIPAPQNETEFKTLSNNTNTSHTCTSDISNDYIRGAVYGSDGNPYNLTKWHGTNAPYLVNITVLITSGNETGAMIENVSVDDFTIPSSLIYDKGFYGVPDDINCLQAGDNFTIRATNGTHFGNKTGQVKEGGLGDTWGSVEGDSMVNITLQYLELDTTPPVVTIISPLNNSIVVYNWTWANVSLNENGSTCFVQYDMNGTNLTMSNSTVNKTTWYINISSMPDGKHNLTFWCNDTSSNWGTNITTFNVSTGTPAITFVSPTPTNATRQTNNWIYVNVTVTASANVDTCTLSWNGTNETMTVVGSGTSVSCYVNKTTTDGQTYTFLVYANDTNSVLGVSQTRQNTENSLPSIAFTNLTPVSPVTTDDLNCSTAGWSDSESDPERYNISFNNGATTLNFFNVTQPFYLLSGNTSKGQTWNCTATPFDQYEYGTAKDSNSITIQNSVPTAPTLNAITPNPASKASTMYSTINTASTDADGDSISYYYQWSNDSGFSYIITQGFNATSPANFSLNCNSYAECQKGSTMYLQVKAVTSDANSSYSSSVSRQISNTIPTLSSVTANVSYAKQGTPVKVNTTNAADVDNDNLRLECGTSSGLSDLCNGTYGSPERECSFLTTWSDNSAHTVYCRVNDSTSISTPDRTTIITTDNTGPTVTYVSPTPASSSRQTNNQVTINVTVTDTNSIDACTLEWNGANESMTRVGSGTSVSCYATKATTDGSSYTFRVYANDSLGNIGSETQRTFNENDKPISNVPTITPASPYTNDSLNCNATLTDGLDSTLTAYWTVYKNGAVNKSGTTASLPNNTNNVITTLTAGDTTAFEKWSCSVIPYDGYENGSMQNSTNVTIQDYTATFSNFGTDDTNHNIIALFYSYVSDIDGLSGCYLETNNSGTFANSTFTPISGTTGWCNVSLVLNNTNGILINWKVYANDSGGTWYASNPQFLSTTNTPPVLTTNPAINNTAPGQTDIINCDTGTYSDSNSDPQSASYWQWWNITGTPTVVGSSQALNLGTISAKPSEKYRCSQRVYDSYDNSSWYDSSNNATIAADLTKPIIRDETATPWIINQSQDTNITANVTDNVAVEKAWVQISYPNTTIIGNFSMTKDGGDIWFYDYVTTSLNSGGNYSFLIFANDTTGNMNRSVAAKEFKVNDITAPQIISTDVSPSVGNQSQTMNVTVTVKDETNLDEVIIQITYPNGTNQNFTAVQDGGNVWYYEFNNTQGVGTYNYTVFSNDTSGNWNNTTIYTFDIQDSTPPKYYSVEEPTDPSIYNPSAPYQFNITLNDTEGNISNVIFEFNGTNYTYFAFQVQNVSSEFYYNFTGLGAGTYTYSWYFNDTNNNWNATTATTFTISTASTSVKLFLNGTEGNVTYPLNDWANFTVTLNVSGKTVYLNTNIPGWVLQSGVTPLVNITQLTSAGLFNITGYFPGDQNYTASSQTWFANVTDNQPPKWFSPSVNSTQHNQSAEFSVYWTDNDVLNQFIFSTNNSGSWTNDSAVLFTGSGSWSNATKTLNNTNDITIGWIIYARDNYGNWNNTGIQTITTTNDPPSVSNVYITSNRNFTLDDLACIGTISDSNGDNESSSTYQWYENSSGTFQLISGQTTKTLDSDYTKEKVYYICEYTPSDGNALGTPVNSSVLAIMPLITTATYSFGPYNEAGNVTVDSGSLTLTSPLNMSQNTNIILKNNGILYSTTNITAHKISISTGNLTIDPIAVGQSLYLKFIDASGAGFSGSGGNILMLKGNSTANVTVTSTNTPPTNHWSTLTVLNLSLSYSTLEYFNEGNWSGNSASFYVVNSVFNNSDPSASVPVCFGTSAGSSVILAFSDNILENCTYGLNIRTNYSNFNDITIRNMTLYDIIAQSGANAKLEFNNSNFNASKIDLASDSSSSIISQNHNDIAGDYYIWTTNSSLYKSNITNDFDSYNLTIFTGLLIIDESASIDNFNVYGLLRVGDGKTLTTSGKTYLEPGGQLNLKNGTWLNLTLNNSNTTVSVIANQITIFNIDSPPSPPSGLSGIGKYFNATNTSASASALINITYNASELGSINQSSLLMWKNNGSWYLEPQTGVNTVAKYVWSNTTRFSIFMPLSDVEAPQGSSTSVNNTQHGQQAKFSVYWTDNMQLGNYIFSTNNSGVWANDSAVTFTGTGNWSNVTKTLSSTNNAAIGWFIYAADNVGNLNVTGLQVLTTTNTLPSITNVNVTPDTAYKTNDLTCNVSGYSDANNDAAQYYYSWWNGSTLIRTVSTSSATNILLSGNITRGDTWTCQVFPYDGYANGTDINDSVTIQNSAPSITSVDVIPDVPNTTSLLTCTPSGWNDADGDSANYYYAWFDNGSVVSGQTSSTFDCGTVLNCDKGDNVTCMVTPNDGVINGTAVNDSEIIENIPPILTAPPTVNDTNPSHISTLKCNNGTYYDEDSDPATNYWRWYKNSSIISGQNNQTIYLLGLVVNGDNITCSQLVSDGTANSSWYNSSNYAIVNITVPEGIRNLTAYLRLLTNNDTTGTSSDGAVTLNWSSSPSPDISNILIYYTNDYTYWFNFTTPNWVLPNTATHYNDTNAGSVKERCYIVRVNNSVGLIDNNTDVWCKFNNTMTNISVNNLNLKSNPLTVINDSPLYVIRQNTSNFFLYQFSNRNDSTGAFGTLDYLGGFGINNWFGSPSSFDKIENDRGYWAKSRYNTFWTIVGRAPTANRTVTLYSIGNKLNLVGFTSMNETKFEKAIKQNASDYNITQISKRNDTTGAWFISDYLGGFGFDMWWSSDPTYTGFDLGIGYWLKSKQNMTWTYTP